MQLQLQSTIAKISKKKRSADPWIRIIGMVCLELEMILEIFEEQQNFFYYHKLV